MPARTGWRERSAAEQARDVLDRVSRILGHADFGTTADVYAHLTPAMLDRAAERMDAILAG